MSDVLETIDGAIWAHGDAMRWSPDPPAVVWVDEQSNTSSVHFTYDATATITVERGPTDSHSRPRYELLSPQEQQALHDWCSLHEIDHKRVPIDPLIELDPATTEWRIETFRTRSGSLYLDEQGEVARRVIRRAHKAELPWRCP